MKSLQLLRHFNFKCASKSLFDISSISNNNKIIRSTSSSVPSSAKQDIAASRSEDVNHGEAPVPVRLETAQANNMMDIGIRKIFTEEHDMFRESVRRFFREEVVPYHNRWEEKGEVSRELWRKAGENGLLGVSCPVEYGGVGGDWLSATIVLEEQSYVNASGPGFGMHSEIVIPYLIHYGTKEQIEKYVPKLVSGEFIAGLAMTEPGAGSDLQGIKTYARQDGSDWILNGQKVFISNGYTSDLIIVVAVTDPKAKSAAHGISLFLLDSGLPGYKKGEKLKKLGLKAQDTCELFFDDVRLPASALLGEANRGFYYLMQELPQERLLIGIMATASCEFMFEETRKYVNERKAFGRTISNLQVIQHKLAEMKTDICVARSFCDSCIKIHNDIRLDSNMASMAKYWLSDMQNKVAYDCLQMFGGWGFMWEYPICKAFADARVQPIYGGSNEIMKELIARQIVATKKK